MRCQNCDYGVVRSMKYCPDCGQKLELPANTGQRVEEFRARSLFLDVLYADFKVVFNNQGVVIVKIDGDERMKEAVNLSLVNGVLAVEGRLPGVEINPDNVSISVNNGIITIDGKRLDMSRKLSIELSLPWNSELEVKQYTFGLVTFTTDAGELVLHNSSRVSIKAKSFDNLEAHISGVGDLVVDDVSQGLTADISGNGYMMARSVKGLVSVDLSGNGGVEIVEIEGSLTAGVSGAGNFEVGHVNLSAGGFTLSGVGKVKIRKGEIQTLTVDTSGVGGFRFNGHVGTGSFSVSGVGGIKVDSCVKILRQKQSGVGKVEVG